MLDEEVLVTDVPTMLAPGTLDAAELQNVVGFELFVKKKSLGLLSLRPAPTAKFTNEGGFAPPSDYRWTDAAEKEMLDRREAMRMRWREDAGKGEQGEQREGWIGLGSSYGMVDIAADDSAGSGGSKLSFKASSSFSTTACAEKLHPGLDAGSKMTNKNMTDGGLSMDLADFISCLSVDEGRGLMKDIS